MEPRLYALFAFVGTILFVCVVAHLLGVVIPRRKRDKLKEALMQKSTIIYAENDGEHLILGENKCTGEVQAYSLYCLNHPDIASAHHLQFLTPVGVKRVLGKWKPIKGWDFKPTNTRDVAYILKHPPVV